MTTADTDTENDDGAAAPGHFDRSRLRAVVWARSDRLNEAERTELRHAARDLAVWALTRSGLVGGIKSDGSQTLGQVLGLIAPAVDAFFCRHTEHEPVRERLEQKAPELHILVGELIRTFW